MRCQNNCAEIAPELPQSCARRFSVSRIMPDIVSPSAFEPGEPSSSSEPGGACLANSFESENLRHVDECESDAECDADCESEAARPSDLRAGAVEGRSSSEPARSSSSSPSVRRRALER